MSTGKSEYTKDLVAYAFHGIDENIPEDATAVVNLRDLLKVNATLVELNQFFHQPLHWKTLADVEEYMGSANTNGAYKLVQIATYDLLRRMLPPETEALFDDGRLDAPNKPYYFEEKSDEL